MARRRSARLASISRTPTSSRMTPNLDSVAEREDSSEEGATQSLDAVFTSPMSAPKTPGAFSSIKLPASEMHPSKFHATMAPPSSGLHLGFADIRPKSDAESALPIAAQSTPSKIAIPSSPSFSFQYSARKNASDSKLGTEAQRMMDEIREEALRIKVELAAKLELEKRDEQQVNGRKFATAKGKTGRFSAIHMEEFKKMDSIQNHPSVFRTQGRRVTPLKNGVKRSQSKANLDDTQPSVKTIVKLNKSKVDLHEAESGPSRRRMPAPTATTSRVRTRTDEENLSEAKRIKAHVDDDASTLRPVSRDGTFLPRLKSAGNGSGIPRSKSTLAGFMTPTKSVLARADLMKTPVHGSLLKSPSKASICGVGLKNSATTNNLPSFECATTPKLSIKSPSRFDAVKSMLRSTKNTESKGQSAIPKPATVTRNTNKELPPVPVSTPGRKLSKPINFTPKTDRREFAQNSPSPIKSGIPRSKSRQILGEVQYPPLDTIITDDGSEEVMSHHGVFGPRLLPEQPSKQFRAASADPTTASTFTFRSDQAMEFGGISSNFGSSPGQTSVRCVRPSILPSEKMPGSFPTFAREESPNKENVAPRHIFPALPHGMENKKRSRPSTDEEEAEQQAAERAAKRLRQQEVPEGDALLAPRLVGASAKKPTASPFKLRSPGFAGGTPGTHKKTGISLSRLNMLARPKLRK